VVGAGTRITIIINPFWSFHYRWGLLFEGRLREKRASARWWHELLSWCSTGARRVIVVIARAGGMGGGRETDWPRVEITARTDVLPCCRHLPFRATARRSDPRAIGGGGGSD